MLYFTNSIIRRTTCEMYKYIFIFSGRKCKGHSALFFFNICQRLWNSCSLPCFLWNLPLLALHRILYKFWSFLYSFKWHFRMSSVHIILLCSIFTWFFVCHQFPRVWFKLNQIHGLPSTKKMLCNVKVHAASVSSFNQYFIIKFITVTST